MTGKDGRQSVAVVKNELGLRAGDLDGIRTRLAQQGVQAKDIGLYGGVDTTRAAKGKAPLNQWGGPGGAKPTAQQQPQRGVLKSTPASSSSAYGSPRYDRGIGGRVGFGSSVADALNAFGKGVARGKGGGGGGAQPRKPPTQFEKNLAAIRIAAFFRGCLARKQALTERRKNELEQRRRQQDEIEAGRRRGRPSIGRPKGKSYIGF